MKNKIKISIKYLVVPILLFIAFGCEDVIEVDLNNAEPRIVIEAEISDYNSHSRVLISKSTDFYSPMKFNGVSGAVVTVSDNKGNIYNFNETTDGIYENVALIGETEVTYYIEVKVDGKTYEATSTIPKHITLDSLSLEKAPSRPGEEGLGRLFLHVYFQDHLGLEEYCRFKLYKNNHQISGFNIYYDKFTDGNYVDYRLILDTQKNDIKLGDIITVELMSIDEAAFNFYKTANSINASAKSNKPMATSVAPANPVTNWNNNALGLFSAYSVSGKRIMIKQ